MARCPLCRFYDVKNDSCKTETRKTNGVGRRGKPTFPDGCMSGVSFDLAEPKGTTVAHGLAIHDSGGPTRDAPRKRLS